MSSLITLRKDYSIKVKSKITDYLNPNKVYIPIKNKYKLNVRNNEEVKKEQILMNDGENYVVSPISGVISGIESKKDYKNNDCKCLVIENDFKERIYKRVSSKKSISNLSFDEMIKLLGLRNLKSVDDGSLLYKTIKEKKGVSTLIINSIEDEPYVVTKHFELINNCNEILFFISEFMNIIGVSHTIITLKNINRELIDKINSVLGTYPSIDIELVPDFYLYGRKDFILNELGCNSDNVLYLNSSDVCNLYTVLKRNHYVTEKLITISGPDVTNPQVVNVKIGSLIGDVIKENFKVKKDSNSVANGLMNGYLVDYNNLIVTEDLNGVIFQKCNVIKEEKCIRCGKCMDICPVNLNPRFLMNHPDEELKNKCIDCGLCNYMCPSYIDISSKIRGDENA